MKTDIDIQRAKLPEQHGVLRFGTAFRLAKGKLHEVLGEGAVGFVLSVASQMDGHVVWISRKHGSARLCPDGLSRFLDPARLILVSTLNPQESLWAAEQALRLPGAALVVLELSTGPDLRQSRRLQLAAEETGAICLSVITGHANTSSAYTRWLCESLADPDRPARWHLTRSKDGQQGRWHVQYPNRLRGMNAPGLVPVAAASAA